jgi:type II secretory pathway component PulJ
MKKRNEGYTLVLVMIVLVILCLLSTYILSFSLKNISTQKAAVLRTQDQYAAMGEIEATVAKLQVFAEKYPEMEVMPKPEEGVFVLTVTEDDNSKTEYVFPGTATCEDNIKIALAAQSDSYRIECTLQFVGTVNRNLASGTYTLSDLTGVEYIRYDISMVTKGGGDDAQTEK